MKQGLNRWVGWVALALLAVTVAGCGSVYHPVGAPREGVVNERVLIQ